MKPNDIKNKLKNAKYKADGYAIRGFYLDYESIKQVLDLLDHYEKETERLKAQIAVYEGWVERDI